MTMDPSTRSPSDATPCFDAGSQLWQPFCRLAASTAAVVLLPGSLGADAAFPWHLPAAKPGGDWYRWSAAAVRVSFSAECCSGGVLRRWEAAPGARPLLQGEMRAVGGGLPDLAAGDVAVCHGRLPGSCQLRLGSCLGRGPADLQVNPAAGLSCLL